MYEGTNSVQAADLVFRKLYNKNGNIINNFMEMIKTECESKSEKVQSFSKQLDYYLDILSKFNSWISENSKEGKDDISAAANDYLKTLGYISLAFSWIKVLDVSYKEYDSNKDFYEDKINTAKFYFDKILPRSEYHYKSAISGSSNIMNFKFN